MFHLKLNCFNICSSKIYSKHQASQPDYFLFFALANRTLWTSEHFWTQNKCCNKNFRIPLTCSTLHTVVLSILRVFCCALALLLSLAVGGVGGQISSCLYERVFRKHAVLFDILQICQLLIGSCLISGQQGHPKCYVNICRGPNVNV